jgi:hypothetical protein
MGIQRASRVACLVSCLIVSLALLPGGSPVLAASQTTSLTVPIMGLVPANWENPPLARYLSVLSRVVSDGAPTAPSLVLLEFNVLTPRTAWQSTGTTYASAPVIRLSFGTYPPGPIHVTAPVTGDAGQDLQVRMEVSLAYDRATGSLTAVEARLTPPSP